MAKRWIGVALLAWCLTQATTAQAQSGEGGCAPQLVPGPMTSEQAPPGPGDCLSLPAWLPNAFTEDCATPGPCLWASAEYIYWDFKSPRLSTTLVTTSPNPPVGNNPPSGLLGQANTSEVLRSNSLKYSPASGARLSGGFWFDNQQCMSLEGSAFVTQDRSTSFKATSDANGQPLIFMPIFDSQGAGTGTGPGEFGFAISIPNFRTGGVTVTSSTELWGAEANLVHRLYRGSCFGVSLIGGFRYLDLEERVDITSQSSTLGTSTVAFGVPFPNSTVSVRDDFSGRNQFYGGQVGVRAGACWRYLFFAIQGKIAAGDMHEVININGTSTLDQANATANGLSMPIPPVSIQVGRFAAPSNSGRHDSERFAIVPEAEGRLGIQLCPAVLAYVGYNFLYMNRVTRPGDQIDRRIDLTQIPTAFQYNAAIPGFFPRVPFNQSYFWAQGVDFGVEVTY